MLTGINNNLEHQAAVYFYHQFIANADSSWKEGTISDLGTVIGGSTPSKSKPEYYTDNGIAWINPKIFLSISPNLFHMVLMILQNLDLKTVVLL